MSIYLVTSAEITKNTPMGGNVDPDKYTNLIIDVQVLTLEPILGTALYDKILSDFDSDSLAGDYLEMFNDYIKPIMWHGVFSEYVKIGAFGVSNGGMYKHTSEDSETLSQDEIDSLAKSYAGKVDAYIGRLEKYLCDKGSDIPEYNNSQPNNYDVDPKSGLRTISGLYFGKN